MAIAYETLPGRSRKNARKALDLAEKNGFAPEDVRTIQSGYLIPIEVDDDENPLGLSAQEATIDGFDSGEADRTEERTFGGEGLTRATESLTGSTHKLAGDAGARKYPDGEPTVEWKAAEIDAWAKDHEIKFDNGVTTKAEKIDAIATAKKEG